MSIIFRILLLLFIVLLTVFFKIQFSVYPYLSQNSVHKLLNQTEALPRQVVLVIIDALRNDYSSRLPFVERTMSRQPKSTFLAKSLVGNPTMTTQRIQSLMTGSEIFSSGNILKTFLASKVDADSIVWQLNHANKSSAVFGDNTWVKLFEFTHSAVCVNTFDVHDLDTCDKVVYDNLPSALSAINRNQSKDSFIIAHLLGIDHVGHSTSSLDDSMMEVKMKELSEFLQQLFEKAENNTFFLVTGDHGMREDGNHGGSTKQQIQTFVFGYLKGGQLYQQNVKTVMAQRDLTTTLSVLLGVPLPNNAVGSLILNLLPKQLVVPKIVTSMYRQLYKHYIAMLEFYSQPLSVDESIKFQSEIAEDTAFGDQEMVLDYMSQKLMFLRYSSPEPTRILVITSFLSFIVLAILVSTFFEQIYNVFCNFRLRTVILLFLQVLPMFTLFISYFSWSVIQNLSDALITGMFVAIVFGVMLSKTDSKLATLLGAFGIFFILAQIEPDKSNDYKPSVLRTQWLNYILSNGYFLFILSTFQLLAYLKYQIHHRSINDSQSNNQLNRKQVILRYIKIFIAILSYTNFIAAKLFENPLYFSSIIQTFIIIAYSIDLSIFGRNTQQDSTADIRFLAINFLSAFMGPHFPLILLACLWIERVASPCHSFSIIMSLLSKCIWWWLGNRYEYSGVDILKTYVYSQSYAIALNGISLVIYLTGPFVLNLVLLNCRLLQERNLWEQDRLGQRKYLGSNADEEDEHLSKSVGVDCETNQKIQLGGQFVKYLVKNNYKYTGVLLLGLVSSIWNTILNNEKILFTVVCVPVLVLSTLITLTTLTIVFCLSIYYQRTTNYFQQSASPLPS